MIKVSIVCITYNHVKFIRQTLDSFVMQKTNFPFEVIIHDDASTDGTTEIIKEYEKRYPNIIKPIYQKENQFSKGKMPIIDFMLDKIKGKYVAFCEGDDYWIDKNKLQKQVDFLDCHPDFSICFHPVKVVWEDKSQPVSIFPTSEFRFNKKVLKLEDLLKQNFIQTNSVIYRWNLKKDEWPKEEFLPCDYLFHLIHASKGKIGFLSDVMGVYRKHPGGIWNGCGQTDEWFIKCGILHARFSQIIQERFKIDKTSEIKFLISSTLHVLLKYKLFDDIKKISFEYPELYNDFLSFYSLNNQLQLNSDVLNKKLLKLKRIQHRQNKIIVVLLLLLILFSLL